MKAVNRAYTKFRTLPMPLQVAGGAVSIFLLYKTYKLLFKNAQEQSNQQIANQSAKELAEYLKNTKLSYPISQYDAMANQIYEGTKYGIGDNYPMVSKTLRMMKNNADVAKLIQAYGARQNYVFGIPVGEKKDLFTNVRSELGSNFGFFSGHITDINDDWAKKGIKYKL